MIASERTEICFGDDDDGDDDDMALFNLYFKSGHSLNLSTMVFGNNLVL